MARRQQFSVGILLIEGASRGNVNVLLTDRFNNALLATGTVVPPDNTSGFAKGCIFIKTDATGNGFYVNVGNAKQCQFKLVNVT